jgi:hypothetical protein
MIPGGMSDLVIPDYDRPLGDALMSIWASVQGDDPKFYAEGYGRDDVIEGFLDVAISCVADRVRIICSTWEKGEIVLDAKGLAELHRRIVVARSRLEGTAQK